MAIALAIALSACASSSVGDGDGDGGTLDAGVGCDEEVTLLGSTAEASPLGFSADAILAHGANPIVSPLFWLNDESASASPEQGEGELTLTTRHVGGEVRFITSTPQEAVEGAPSSCRSRLEVDVELSLSTKGGALAEKTAATLSSSDTHHASLHASIAPTALGGALVVTPKLGDGYTVEALDVDAGLVDGFSSGKLTAQLTFDDGNVAGAGVATLARWPTADATCELGVPTDVAYYGFSADDALATVTDRSATLTWEGAGSTAVTFTLEAIDAVACVGSAYAPDDEALELHATLRATSEDGRFDGGIPVVATANANPDGSLGAIVLQRAWVDGAVPAADFESTYGLRGFDVSGFESASVTVYGTFDASSSEGSLEVDGLTSADCSNAPGAGCAGTELTKVGGASWVSP